MAHATTKPKKALIALIVSLVLVGLALPTYMILQSVQPDPELRSIVKPYTFSLWKHELGALFRGLGGILRPGESVATDDTAVVREYFMLVGQIKDTESTIALTDGHEEETKMLEATLARLEERRSVIEARTKRILEKQIRQVLVDQGILNPLDRYLSINLVFPPLQFELEEPPSLLVISPRDRIKLQERILLSPNLELEEKEAIESEVDDLGVSSLVVELSGFAGVWPTMVAEDLDLHRTLKIVIEEWFHQYLAFRPLGFLYLLDSIGVRKNGDIATMNETLAGMVAEEISSEVISTFYQGDKMEDQSNEAGFDFDEEMRQTRRAVDEYLAQGKIEEAEKFMEEKGQHFIAEGYHIRELNQAYFAFHGVYAYKPASTSPIYDDLRELRGQSSSLKEFVDKVAAMTSYDDLQRAADCPWPQDNHQHQFNTLLFIFLSLATRGITPLMLAWCLRPRMRSW